MARRGVLKGVLDNFLGTYTSRYSSFSGYWLMGFLVSELGRLEFDLLAAPENVGASAKDIAALLAVVRFREQMAKHGVPMSRVRSGRVAMEKVSDEVDPLCPRFGYRVRVVARVTSDRGREFEAERLVCAAPHNPRLEWQSARGR